MTQQLSDDHFCSIQRALDLVGEKWTFLILREVLIEGETRFADFGKILRIGPNILADRLNSLVQAGILERREYQERGSRTRASYHATAMGLSLRLVLAALQQWGDDHVPHPAGPTQERVTADDRRPVRVTFVDDLGRPREDGDVQWLRTAAYPTALREASVGARKPPET
ncbi:helix-turn-helix domain-containing protein [Amycolatopsis sp. GM8]|uniref:winged helix-turn-helix transcriptional regulator n=1 Tax=Amycolatopsis sp. GM8 TaxID=2896530 RepID=UPI001F453236|nr:helix-turn-helix domain-containing protein [Amycolatopsis sp. GM8]